MLVEYGNLYQITWAGDLDGDGRPDFLVEHTPEFRTFDLFLSSRTGGRGMRHAARLQRMSD